MNWRKISFPTNDKYENDIVRRATIIHLESGSPRHFALFTQYSYPNPQTEIQNIYFSPVAVQYCGSLLSALYLAIH
jgi:hypothetical protein